MRSLSVIFLVLFNCSYSQAATICACSQVTPPGLVPISTIGDFRYSNSEFLSEFGHNNTSAYLIYTQGQPTQIYISTTTWEFSNLQLFGRSSDLNTWIEIPLNQIPPNEFTPASPRERMVEYSSSHLGVNQLYLAADYTNGERELFATIPIATIPEPSSALALLLSLGLFFQRRKPRCE